MNQGMRRSALTLSRTRVLPPRARQWQGTTTTRRAIQIWSAASEQDAITGAHLPIANTPDVVQSSDARFEVIGTPYSLLSVSLSASQNLYTRRGTLVGLSGKANNVVSSLSVLEPIRRAPLGIPFLYQKVSSASPVTALLSVRSPTTSFGVVNLDGSVDWMVSQRRALLAWTGRSVSIRPVINKDLTEYIKLIREKSVAHWGSSEVTGRGLLALVGNGQLYNMELRRGEQYIVHPSNVVAYSMSSNPPRPYRFKSTTLNFQVPGLKTLPRMIQNTNFIRNMSDTETWKTVMTIFHKLRSWSRMTIWGDRLFLQFDGPANIIVQSRGARVNDILSERQVNEIAGTPQGLILGSSQDASGKSDEQKFREEANEAVHAAPVPSRSVDDLVQEVKGNEQRIANLTQEGKIIFEKPDQKK